MPAGRQVLRIECSDEKGLIHKITGVLYRRGLNVVENDEFVDRENGRFFMRSEFSGKASLQDIAAQLRKLLPRGSKIDLSESRPKRIVIFASKEAHCLGDLLIRHAYGELQGKILAVFSNHKTLGPLAKRFGVPFHFVSSENKGREEHEAAFLEILSKLRPEYIVLAKYMRFLSENFIRRFESRIVNIHHSFLPAFAGASPYKQAAERGVKIVGATAHFATEKLDEGPIIAQGVMPVNHTQSVEDMAQAGRDVEKMVLARALQLAFEDRIFVSQNRTILFD